MPTEDLVLSNSDTNSTTYVRLYVKQQENNKQYHIYLCSEIGEADRYVDMFHYLKIAEPHDEVFIYVNTPGGYMSTGVQIVENIRSCAATVTTVLEAEAHSAGSFIFLSGDEFMVGTHAMMLIHNLSLGYYTKGAEGKKYMQAITDHFDQLSRDIYYPFLSEEEIEQVMRDDDMWLNHDEIVERIGRLMEYKQLLHLQHTKDQLQQELSQMEADCLVYKQQINETQTAIESQTETLNTLLGISTNIEKPKRRKSKKS